MDELKAGEEEGDEEAVLVEEGDADEALDTGDTFEVEKLLQCRVHPKKGKHNVQFRLYSNIQ